LFVQSAIELVLGVWNFSELRELSRIPPEIPDISMACHQITPQINPFRVLAS
jgi:hypothetical protein